MCEGLFDFAMKFLSLLHFQCSNRLIYPCKTAFFIRISRIIFHFLYVFDISFDAFVNLFNFDVLFNSSPYMLYKALSIPKNFRMSRSVFCDASHV